MLSGIRKYRRKALLAHLQSVCIVVSGTPASCAADAPPIRKECIKVCVWETKLDDFGESFSG